MCFVVNYTMFSIAPFSRVSINRYFYPSFPAIMKNEDKTKNLLLCNNSKYVIEQPLIHFWLILKGMLHCLSPAP